MTNFVNPLTPIGFCVLMLESRLARTRREDGASAVEWVIIAAIVVGICIAVAGNPAQRAGRQGQRHQQRRRQPVTRPARARACGTRAVRPPSSWCSTCPS